MLKIIFFKLMRTIIIRNNFYGKGIGKRTFSFSHTYSTRTMLQDDSGDELVSNCEKSQRELSQFLSPLQATLTELNEAVTFYDDIIRFIVDISLDKSTIKLTIFKDEQISQKLERLKLENLTFLSLQEEIKMELNEELSSDEKLYFINGMLSHLSKITIANIPVLAKLKELCLVIKSEVALLQGKPQLTNLFEKLSACDISLFAPSIDPRSIDEDERLWSQEVNTISSQIRAITLQVVPEHYTNVKALNEICELICKCNHLSEAYLIQAP